MISIPTRPIRMVAASLALSLLAASTMAFAQDQAGNPPPSPPSNPGWRRFSNPPLNDPTSRTVPSRVTLQAGTFVTVRVDQMLSSDRNKAGDEFSATLTRPLVAEGVVVAQRGEILGGRVAEAQKAGRVTGVSRLAVQLTDLTLVDGQQVPIETELTSLAGPTSKARDAGAIAGTTAVGAGVGAAAGLGVGAAIGAGAGAIVGTVGVLVTRGHATVIYPESVLTFRLSAPITISTDRAPQAFRYVDTANKYNRASAARLHRLVRLDLQRVRLAAPTTLLLLPLLPLPLGSKLRVVVRAGLRPRILRQRLRLALGQVCDSRRWGPGAQRLVLPSHLFGAQAGGRIFVGVGRYDLPKVDAVEISTGISFLAHRLHQRLGRHIIPMQRPALVVHNAFLDNGRAHLPAWNRRQVRLLKLVVISPGNRPAMAHGRR